GGQHPLAVLFDPFDPGLENANLVVFAKSGAGKSYFTKLMALRNLLAGVEFLVIDPEDEYRALCAAVGGQYVRLAASSAQRLNPFDLPPPDAAARRRRRRADERPHAPERVAAAADDEEDG